MSLTKVTYAMISNAPINPYDYGVIGDGVADDSAAMIAAALAASGKRLYVPAGTYRVKGVDIYANTTVDCDVNAVFTPADLVTNNSTNYCVQIIGDNVTWRGGKISGEVYTVLGDTPAPYYGLSVRKSTGDQHPLNTRIEDLEVIGCSNGVFITSSGETTVQNVTVRSCYMWGLAFANNSSANFRTDKLIVNNVRAYDIGLYEGIKIAANTNSSVIGDSTKDIIISNVDVQRCGALDPSAQQNGMDFFIGAAQRLQITNFNLVDNGNTGIEIKRENATWITPNTFKEILVQDGIITSSTSNSGGITFNFTGSSYPAAGTAGNVIISNVQFNYNGLTEPATAYGISFGNYTAFDKVLVTGCQFNGMFRYTINPSTITQTMNDLVISGCSMHGVLYGISINDTANNVYIMDNVIVAKYNAIYMNGTASSNIYIEGGHYETTGTNTERAIAFGSSTLLTNVVIEKCTIIGDGYAIGDVAGTVTIRNNHLTTKSSTHFDAINVYDGTCIYHDNSITLSGTTKGSYYLNGGSVTSFNNVIGYSSSIPVGAGRQGDIVKNTATPSGGYIGWVCTTSGSSSTAVWKGYGAIA